MMPILLKRSSASSRNRGCFNSKGGAGFQTSLDRFLSNSWPYESVSPVQAYLTGVFTCVAVFVAYNFLFRTSSTAEPRRHGGTLNSKSPRKRRNRNMLEPGSAKRRTINGGAPRGVYSSPPPAPMSAIMLSKDIVYRRLSSRMRARVATRAFRKSERLAKKAPGEAIAYDESPRLIGHGHAPGRHRYKDSIIFTWRDIARRHAGPNQVRRNQEQIVSYLKRGYPSARKRAMTASAHGDGDVWPTSSGRSQKSSHKLFEHKSSHPLTNGIQKSCVDVLPADGDKEIPQAGSIHDGVIANTNDNERKNVAPCMTPSSGKENINIQILGDGDPDDATTAESRNCITEKSYQKNTNKFVTPPRTMSSSYGARLSERQFQKRRNNNGDSGNRTSNIRKIFPAPANSMVTPVPPLKSHKDIHVDGPGGCRKIGVAKADIAAQQSEKKYKGKKIDQPLHGAESITLNPGKLCSTPPRVASKAHLTILISKGVYDYIQASNQKAAMDLLDNLCITYSIVDGMDPLQREKRDAFFKISGIRGNYPQIFSNSACGDCISYLGGYNWLRSCKIEDLKAITNVDLERSSAVKSAAMDARLAVLISNGVYDYTQAANQKAALNLLNDLCVPYDIIDGMDPFQREKRDLFFQVSGVRGNYPQIFLTTASGEIVDYLGGYDWLHGIKMEDLKSIASD